ncbi:hypothetical protein WOLCODRAFT_97721 [Wolfiporia cocos MD-104 SS10]|uniref:Uncharacterized protein n=1 Tax=Wolfiporia cocos (strain MD-104) TaxID=742152 RepID=A0A2H3JDS9_WOLCO|nr:hypothetical protein WOLCODRAFT_97721 [Wolfiporia cocos MD-104 SS10]
MPLAVAKAWKQEYAGASHELLLNEIRTMNSECRPKGQEPYVYANTLPIIQSSGTGKSRTVDEMAKLIFTIPFCIRQPNDKSGLPYPPADTEVVSFLLKNDAAYYEDVLLRYLIFFEHLFSRVEEVMKELTKDQYTDECDLARVWWDYLTTNRASLYESVIKRITYIPHATADEIKRQARDTVATGTSLIDYLKTLTPRQTLDGNDGQTSLDLVVYFDEAQTLAKSMLQTQEESAAQDDTQNRPRSRYDALLSALNRIRHLTLFAVTLSTNSSLHELAASLAMHASMRLHQVEYNSLQAPYTELPFDCLLNGKHLIEAGQCTLKDTCQVSFISRFGRPLWATLYENGDDGVRESLIALAMAKLTGTNNFSDQISTTSTDLDRARLAILSVRLLLDFNITQEMARTTTVDMVTSNMRIAYSAPKHREYLWSGYPSEPILAEAAFRAMARLEKPAISIIASAVNCGLVERGNRGELIMRLLLTEAFDTAAKKEYGVGDGLSVSKPVSLFAFIEALLGATKLEEVKNKVPENIPSPTKTFEVAFKDAVVHFTHFVRNEDMSVSNSYGAWAALARGAAMQCAPNQDVIDCIIPVLLNSKDKLCENAMTGLLIQCKNKRSDSAVTIKEEKMNGGRGFFPRTSKDDRPYIGLLMQLGSRPKSDSCVEPRMNPQRAAKKYAQHPRYFIDIKGCSPDQYPIITAEASNSYAALLGSRNMYSEHARHNSASMKSVQRLKPMWTTRREDTYSWLKDPEFEEVIKQDLQIGPD